MRAPDLHDMVASALMNLKTRILLQCYCIHVVQVKKGLIVFRLLTNKMKWIINNRDKENSGQDLWKQNIMENVEWIYLRLDIIFSFSALLPSDHPSLCFNGDKSRFGLLWWELKAYPTCSTTLMTCKKIPGPRISAEILWHPSQWWKTKGYSDQSWEHVVVR